MPLSRTCPALLSAAALCLPALPAAARDSAPIVLDTVILTGGFSPVEADAYGRAATVITGRELEQRGAATVQEALRALPGVSLVTSGGSLAELRIRDLSERTRLTARVTNLFDKPYQETWGYGTQGRAAWMGIEQRW